MLRLEELGTVLSLEDLPLPPPPAGGVRLALLHKDLRPVLLLEDLGPVLSLENVRPVLSLGNLRPMLLLEELLLAPPPAEGILPVLLLEDL